MPNWCNNLAIFTHEDPEQIATLLAGFKSVGLFSTFLPCPSDLQETLAGSYGDPEKDAALAIRQKANIKKYGAKDWFDWQVANWGTKWDVVESDTGGITARIVEQSPDGKTVKLGFDSAWSPPLAFYEFITDERGFHVEAFYYESGCAFCGYWSSDGDADSYDIEPKADWVRKHIPSAIDECFAISENMEMWEDNTSVTAPKEDA